MRTNRTFQALALAATVLALGACSSTYVHRTTPVNLVYVPEPVYHVPYPRPIVHVHQAPAHRVRVVHVQRPVVVHQRPVVVAVSPQRPHRAGPVKVMPARSGKARNGRYVRSGDRAHVRNPVASRTGDARGAMRAPGMRTRLVN